MPKRNRFLSATLYTLDMVLNGVASHAVEQLNARQELQVKLTCYLLYAEESSTYHVTGKEAKNAFAVV
jgi:hypothetical protein